MADDDIRDSATDSDDEAAVDLSFGNEHSAFLEDEELHEQLVDDSENDERTALTAAHQGSSGTSTPSSEAAAFVLPTDEALPDSAEDRAGSRNSSNGAAAGNDQPGTGADSLVGLDTDQPGENAGNTQGERATPNRTAGAASDPAANQVAAQGNSGSDNQPVENAEGGNNAAQAGNPSDSAAALGADPLAQAVTPGGGASQGNQANAQAGEGAGGTAEQDAPGGTQPPPEEDETAEVVVEEAAPPPPPAPPVVPDPNTGPATADAVASGEEDAASISVTITGSDVDGTVDTFALSSLPTDGTLYLDAGLTTVAATGTDYAASGGSLTLYFVPDADFNGDVTFDYAATDDDDAVDATPATATITVTEVVDTITGTAGDDLLVGTAGTDIINGLGGNDTLVGGAGDDTLDGGAGDDVIIFDAADASIDGGSGTDTLQVGSGDIDLSAFGGTISGIEQIDMESDAGANTLTLSAQDVIDFSDTSNTLTVTGDGGDAIEIGTNWTDAGLDINGNQVFVQVVGPDTATLVIDPDVTVNSDAESSGMNPIIGDSSDNVLNGTADADLINAQGGDDILSGGGGHDHILAGKGDDTIEGGIGDDTLAGGHGDDTFLFSDADFGGAAWTDSIDGQGTNGAPPVSDYDTIDLSNVTQGWTLEVDGAGAGVEASSGDNPSEYTNGADFSGTITFDDGSTVVFDNIEKVDW